MSQCFKELAVPIMHEKQFKIGGVPSFAAAELSKREHRERTGRTVMMGRMIELAGQACMADSSRLFHHRFSKLREGLREFRWRSIRLQQMADVDQKQLS